MRIKKSFVLSSLIIMFMAAFGALSLPSAAYAAVEDGACGSGFLTFPAWYRGVVDGECNVVVDSGPDGLSIFIWKIATNIVEILLNVAGYVSLGYIIYGGYKYMISTGSPDAMVAARKTIMNAVVGLVISIMSIAIVNVIAQGFN